MTPKHCIGDALGYCNLMHFQALSVEYIHLEGEGDDKNTLKEFMEERGYSVRSWSDQAMAKDYIFVKKGFNEDVKLPDRFEKDMSPEKKQKH